MLHLLAEQGKLIVDVAIYRVAEVVNAFAMSLMRPFMSAMRLLLKSAKGADGRRHTAKKLAGPLGGALDTAPVLREFLQSVPANTTRIAIARASVMLLRIRARRCGYLMLLRIACATEHLQAVSLPGR